ncbi:phytoene desaturase family protein [Methylocystis heyeri]|uniref:NAD(P)-binding protein n=1 Tax=Methylocystis heyeri TaxID=391905 RepID=A0A6B8KB61_9HYPH|nr:NAD(P)/FAD-dependent oxidoreductase [Methylocystis heyeri]QGM45604.1 NAD(P)-binding protein [Methylocystis heyeri]
MTTGKKFDAVVIGSGLGGLTAGALLAKRGYSVCLLERNFSLGGAASVYRVGNLTVESSLHQTSDARNPRDPKHGVLSELGILDEIEWRPTGPLHNVRGGPVGENFALPAGFDAAYDALASRFPDKSQAIKSFLNEVEQIHDSLWTIRQARETGSVAKFAKALWEIEPAARGWQDSLDEVFERDFGGAEALKCALGANLLYFGDDPARTWWIYYALAQGANIASGGVYIKGGSRQLSLKLAKAITKAGGVVRLGRLATAIETDSEGHVARVRHVARKSGEDEETLDARVVMANCSPAVAGDLLPAQARELMEAEFGARPLSTSLFCANFGLKAKPETVGLKDYSSIVLPQSLTRFSQYGDGAGAMGGDPENGALPLYSVANFTAVDSGLWDDPPILVSVLGLDRLDNWRNVTREDAGERRERWLDAFQDALERDYPGFSSLVTDRMMLNAHSMAGYLNTPDGAVYGFEPLPPEDPIVAGFPRTPRTPVGGLYLSSAFGGEHGFNGAILSGAEAARLAAGRLESCAEAD